MDRNNTGLSYIIALGSFAGGELRIQNPGGDELHTVTRDEPLHLGGLFRPGQATPGIMVETHDKLHQFDGALLHKANIFSGDRFSLD